MPSRRSTTAMELHVTEQHGYDVAAQGWSFDKIIAPEGLSRLKWEMEIDSANDPELLSFGTADMDFKSPPAVIEAIRAVVDRGHFGYPYKRKSYYAAVIGYLDRHFGWKVEADWFEFGVGIYQSMHPIITELTAPGDAIIFQPPVHHIFPEIIAANERVPIANPLRNDGGVYMMDYEALEASITGRTKLLLLCSPHNPVGRVWTRDELARLEQICARHGIVVVADEVYSGLLYPGVEFVPYAMISERAAQRSFALLSPSKPFNLTGLKHSIVISANDSFRAAYRRGLARTNLGYGGSAVGIAAAEAAYRDSDAWTASLMEYVAANFAFVQSRVDESGLPIGITVPEATYLCWLDLSKLGVEPDAYRLALENEARLIVTYGEPMGAGGDLHIRLNLATSRTNLSTGLARLLEALNKLTNKNKI